MNNLGIIEQMQAQLKEANTSIELLKYRVSELEAHFNNGKSAPDEVKSAQQIRDEIIEKAKRDVENLQEIMVGERELTVGNKTFRYLDTVAEFHVNKQKRAVTALVKGARIPTLYEKGIAKCTPNDCFNVHIGKAIALRRALGLTVPDEYLNAPQPEEVRVGDIVKWPHVSGEYKVVSTENCFGNIVGYNHDGSTFKVCGGDFSHAKIIDDSRE